MGNKKLNKALISLKKKQYFFDNYTPLNHGKNSICWKVYNKNQVFCLKFYKENLSFKRDRFDTEKNFLELLNLEKFKNVPKLICDNRNENWSLLEWLNGEKIQKPNKRYWEKYLNFIISLQELKYSKYVNKIQDASEACFEIKDHYKLILFRFNKIVKLTSKEKKFLIINNWLEQVIMERLNFLKIQIENKGLNLSISRNKKIISPSDVGFHNIIRFKKELYFFDFEYAGWDDPYKLFVDLVIQPENILNQKKAIYVIDNIAESFKIKINKSLLLIYLELYRIKWILIILNKIVFNEIEKESDVDLIFSKINNYYNYVGEIWLLD